MRFADLNPLFSIVMLFSFGVSLIEEFLRFYFPVLLFSHCTNRARIEVRWSMAGLSMSSLQRTHFGTWFPRPQPARRSPKRTLPILAILHAQTSSLDTFQHERLAAFHYISAEFDRSQTRNIFLINPNTGNVYSWTKAFAAAQQKRHERANCQKKANLHSKFSCNSSPKNLIVVV